MTLSRTSFDHKLYQIYVCIYICIYIDRHLSSVALAHRILFMPFPLVDTIYYVVIGQRFPSSFTER